MSMDRTSSTDIHMRVGCTDRHTLVKQGVMGGARYIPLERAMRMARLQITHVQMHACRETPRPHGGCDELSGTAVAQTTHATREANTHTLRTKRSLLPQTSRTRESTGGKKGSPTALVSCHATWMWGGGDDALPRAATAPTAERHRVLVRPLSLPRVGKIKFD